jgi:hypothetical protein
MSADKKKTGQGQKWEGSSYKEVWKNVIYVVEEKQKLGCWQASSWSQWSQHTDKKEKKIFLIYKEIQKGSGAKPYMKKGLLIYG